MVAGHFALATAVRTKYPEVPLWALMVSTQLLDIIFIPLYVANIEKIVSVGSGGYGEAIIHADYTHSLLGALVIAAVAGFIARRWLSKKGSLVIAAMVFSHWILDLIVHRMDMPLFPGNFGNLPLFGFGLWGEPLWSLALEFLMVVLASILYTKFVLSKTAASPARRKRAVVSSVVLSSLLILSLLGSLSGF